MEEMSRISLAYGGPDYAVDERENEDKKLKNVASKKCSSELEPPLGPHVLTIALLALQITRSRCSLHM